MSETQGPYFTPADADDIANSMAYDGRSDAERKMARLSQLVAYTGGQVQNLSGEVRGLRKQVDEYSQKDSRTAADLAQLKDEVDGLRQWVVRLVREKEAAEIETVCAWCGKHISGIEGAAPERVSHGICPQCLKEHFPEMVTEAVA